MSGVHLCLKILSRITGWWLAQFDLRNGAVRKKYDSLKYTLKKLEVRQGRDTTTCSTRHMDADASVLSCCLHA